MRPGLGVLRGEGRQETTENNGISYQCVGAVEKCTPINIRVVEETRGGAVDFGKELPKW